MKKCFIVWGDIHADWKMFQLNQKVLFDICKKENIEILFQIQVGDMFWHNSQKYIPEQEIPMYCVEGNHDDLTFMDPRGKEIEIAKNVFYMPRGSIKKIGNLNFLFVGGAGSIDKNFRISQKLWWENEEINEEDFINTINKIKTFNQSIDIVVSHDMPGNLEHYFGLDKPIPIFVRGRFLLNEDRVGWKTRDYLKKIYNELNNPPLRWFFGHHHKNKTIIENKTQFQCVSDCSTLNYKCYEVVFC